MIKYIKMDRGGFKNFLTNLEFKQITEMNSNHTDVLFVKSS